MNKKSIYILLKVLLIVVLFIVMIISQISFGWFSTTFESNNRVGYKTSNIEYPEEIKLWMYLTEEEAGGESTTGWVEQSINIDGENVIVPSVNPSISGNVYTYSLSKLHFGMIDNLLTLKEDNIIYMRIKIDRSRFGDAFNVSINPYNDVAISGEDSGHNSITNYYSFDLYDGAANDGTTEHITNISVYEDLVASLEGNSLVDYEYALSDSSLTPSDNDFSNLEFNSITNEIEFVTDGTPSYYYIYIKLMPNLDSFINISKVLYLYMPCVILHDLEMVFDFRNYQR